LLIRVLECLQQQRWFDTTQPFECTINFTRGACAWLLLTRRGVPQTYVKFSEHVSLQAEAQRFAEASRHHATLVPRYLGHAQYEGLDVLVCEAVDYVGLNAVRMRSRALQRRVLSQLLPYFRAVGKVRLAAALTPLPNHALAAAMRRYFDATAQAARARRWLSEEALNWMAHQPDVPQHGDLALNNLGLRLDRSLIVFDWEDLGAVCVPGLDLFTLELSLAGGAAALLQGRRETGSPTQAFVESACAAMDLVADEYRAMTPVYALVFRFLKRNYGPGVRERMDELLAALARESETI
jgi:hypothetical protein